MSARNIKEIAQQMISIFLISYGMIVVCYQCTNDAEREFVKCLEDFIPILVQLFNVHNNILHFILTNNTRSLTPVVMHKPIFLLITLYCLTINSVSLVTRECAQAYNILKLPIKMLINKSHWTKGKYVYIDSAHKNWLSVVKGIISKTYLHMCQR